LKKSTEKQEPALVDFLCKQQQESLTTKKYTDNINALETLLTIIKENRKETRRKNIGQNM
jgi:hypothetical protein